MVPEFGRITTLFQEPLSTEPMGGVVGPAGDLRVFHGTQAVAVAAVAVHMQFRGDCVPLEACVKEHGAERGGSIIVRMRQKRRWTVFWNLDARNQAVRLRVVHVPRIDQDGEIGPVRNIVHFVQAIVVALVWVAQ